MKYIITLFTLILSVGCSTLNPKCLVSPSEPIYYQANELYENKDYPGAIGKYKLFLEKNPQSELTTPAKLNLGMSYYYTGDCVKALGMLKNVNINDANLKKFLDSIITECSQKMPVLPQEELSTEKTTITVTDAYFDDSGSLVIKGQVSNKCQLYIEGIAAMLNDNNEFKTTVSWKKGNPIAISGVNNGNEEKINYFPDSEEPKEPKNIRLVNSTSNSVDIEWDTNSEVDIKGYKLYYRLKGDQQREVPDLIKKTRYEVLGLEGLSTPTNKTFQFYLRAVDKMNNYSTASDIFETTLP